MSPRCCLSVMLATAMIAGPGCTSGTVYRRGPAAPRIEMREPHPGVIEIRRGERIRVACTDGSIVRGHVAGLESAPESLLIVVVPESGFFEDPETLQVRLREIESFWLPDHSERAVGSALFVAMIAILLGSLGYAFHGLAGLS